MNDLDALQAMPDMRHRAYKPRRFIKDRRRRFLERLAEHGSTVLACKEVGVSTDVVKDYVRYSHLGKQFQAKMDMAIELARSTQLQSLTQSALQGHEEPLLDKDGKQITVEYQDPVTGQIVKKPGWKVKYETPLRCKLFDVLQQQLHPETTKNTNNTTGVLAVPVPVASIDAWRNLVNTLRPAEEPLPAGILAEGEEVKR